MMNRLKAVVVPMHKPQAFSYIPGSCGLVFLMYTCRETTTSGVGMEGDVGLD